LGLTTWIIIVVLVLAVIGFGSTKFFDGVMLGAQKVEQNPIIKNATSTASQFAANATTEAVNKLMGN